jgi:predicted ATPase
MPNSIDNLIIITGGPGSGKSTLIAALATAGFDTAPEAGRALIRQQVRIGGDAHLDPNRFAELALSWDMRSYEWALTRTGPVFFDHGVPGAPAHFRMAGRPVPAHVEAAVSACRYRKLVFVAPAWREIYRNDAERRQTWDEALVVHRTVRETYPRSGYQLRELPRADIRTRMDFVRRSLDL